MKKYFLKIRTDNSDYKDWSTECIITVDNIPSNILDFYEIIFEQLLDTMFPDDVGWEDYLGGIIWWEWEEIIIDFICKL